jgi:hypothetical protein
VLVSALVVTAPTETMLRRLAKDSARKARLIKRDRATRLITRIRYADDGTLVEASCHTAGVNYANRIHGATT